MLLRVYCAFVFRTSGNGLQQRKTRKHQRVKAAAHLGVVVVECQLVTVATRGADTAVSDSTKGSMFFAGSGEMVLMFPEYL